MNNKIKNAAIVLLGLGEKHAAEILKNMDPKEVSAIVEAINNLNNVTEEDVGEALDEFFRESTQHIGIDLSSKEYIKNSLLSAVGQKGRASFADGDPTQEWVYLLRMHSAQGVVELIQDEHPQIITAIVMTVSNNINNEEGANLIKALPKELQNQVMKRMTNIGTISKFAMDTLSKYFDKELEGTEKNKSISVDGIETAANIISCLDSETEHALMEEISKENKEIGEQIQDKIFSFPRLATLDKRSLQTLLSEVKNEELVLALKGADATIKKVFLENMSQKSADILRDDLESMGPVKLAKVVDAQKNIVNLAKKLAQEEKIILVLKNDPGVVF